MTFEPNRNLINKQLADQSHAHTSWDPEKRSAQEIQGFVDHIKDVYDSMQKYAKTDAQKQLLDTEMERYQAGYATKYNADLAAKGRTFSSMITGGSKFPTRRHEKANQAEQNRYDEMKQWDDRAQAAILRELKKLAVEEAGGEVEVLKKKITDAERNHEFMVKANAIVRKKISDDQKVKEIQAIGTISEKTAHEILKPDYMGRMGFPAYALSNDTANIHRMKERLVELEKKESTPTSEIEFTGGTIIDNATEDRVQIQFDSIPSQELRTKLKGEGWRWSPHNGVWQRKRTDQAIWSAERILGIKVERERFVSQKVDAIKQEIKYGLKGDKTVEVPEVILKEAIINNSTLNFKKDDKVAWRSPTMTSRAINGIFVKYLDDKNAVVVNKLPGFNDEEYTVPIATIRHSEGDAFLWKDIEGETSLELTSIKELLDRIKAAKTKDEVKELGTKLNKYFSEGALALMPPRSVQLEAEEVYNNKLKEFEIKQELKSGETIEVPENVLKEAELVKNNSELTEALKIIKNSFDIWYSSGDTLDSKYSTDMLTGAMSKTTYIKQNGHADLERFLSDLKKLGYNNLKEWYESQRGTTSPEIQEIKKELTQGKIVKVLEIKIPGLMKKGTLPDPDWEFEKQQDERIKREQEREVNPDDYYRDYETEKDDFLTHPDDIKNWMESEIKKEISKGTTVEVPASIISKKEFYEPKYWHDPKTGRHPASGSGRLQINQVPFIEPREVGGKMVWYVKNPYTEENFYFDYDKLEDAKKKYNSLYDEFMKVGVGLKKELVKGEIIEVPESVLKTDLKPMKELWEMTYQEFASEFMDKYNDSGYSFAERIGKPLGIESQAGEPLRIINGKKRGYPQSLIRDRWRYVILQDAINRGKKLSTENMSDYLENQKNFPILLEGSAKPVISEVKEEILKGETVVIPESKLIAGLRPTKKIERFDKSKDYIGIKYKGKNHLGEWEERMEMTKHHGRPYSVAEWDSIIEYTPEKWAELKELIQKEADANNRDAQEDSLNSCILQIPRWTTRPKPEKEIKYTDINKGETVNVPEVTLQTDLKPMKNVVATYRNLAWDAKEKGKYKQAAEFYEIAINNYELHPVEGELYKSDLANLKKLHTEVLELSKISKGETAVLPESSLKTMTVTQVPTAEAKWRKFDDHKSETKAVKEALRDAGIEAEVGHGKGTAWGWLEINIGDPRTRKGLKLPPMEYQYNEEEQALHNKVLKIAKEVTGRHGEYDGNISLLAQEWRTKKAEPSTTKNWLIKSKDGKFTLTRMHSTEKAALKYAKEKYGDKFSLHESEKTGQYIPKVSDADLEKARAEGKQIREALEKRGTIEVNVPQSKIDKIIETKGKPTIPDKPPYGKEYPRHRMVRILVETDKNGKEIYYQTIDPMWKKRISLETVNSLKSEGRAFLTGKGIDDPVSKSEVKVADKSWGKIPAPKFMIGEMVYSWQNPSIPAEIRSVNLTSEPGYDHTYILRLPNEEGTGTHNSKHLNETGISRIPIKSLSDQTSQIIQKVSRGAIVEVPKTLLIKQLEAPPAPLSLYTPSSILLLERGETIELSGTKLDELLQRTEKKQSCIPPVHVHAYDVHGYTRKCPTNKGKNRKGK